MCQLVQFCKEKSEIFFMTSFLIKKTNKYSLNQSVCQLVISTATSSHQKQGSLETIATGLCLQQCTGYRYQCMVQRLSPSNPSSGNQPACLDLRTTNSIISIQFSLGFQEQANNMIVLFSSHNNHDKTIESSPAFPPATVPYDKVVAGLFPTSSHVPT
eukprot:TRINITY_DN5141_c1_g1_i10.p3 TRINITY_DN5141_c1_g1~~TRINITY_DN5141_c1_g1_i10.p3  ORF type:complete len:158 (+),score=9.49 TRINITY_DN5141_c1_g1_i10:198-671(+)